MPLRAFAKSVLLFIALSMTCSLVVAAEITPNAASIEQQAKCAKQAREQFRSDGFAGDNKSTFTNHYSAKLNKCFLLVSSTELSNGSVYLSKVLEDAFEGKVFGRLDWYVDKSKTPWEQTRVNCDIITLSGESKFCKSPDEFVVLTDFYMQ